MENVPEINQPEEVKAPEAASEEKALHIKLNKKTLAIAGIVLAVLVVAYLLKGLVIAATVNGAPISRFAVISELEKVSGKNALESMITRKLISNEARVKDITVSKEEVAAEIKNIADRLKAQGQELAAALESANMKQSDLEEQIEAQKVIEKLVADKIAVTGEEVANYIKEYKVPVTKGQEVEINSQIQEQLRQQKLSEASSALVDTLRAAAKIRYFVNYAK
jgi:foldase protein PrsA